MTAARAAEVQTSASLSVLPEIARQRALAVPQSVCPLSLPWTALEAVLDLDDLDHAEPLSPDAIAWAMDRQRDLDVATAPGTDGPAIRRLQRALLLECLEEETERGWPALAGVTLLKRQALFDRRFMLRRLSRAAADQVAHAQTDARIWVRARNLVRPQDLLDTGLLQTFVLGPMPPEPWNTGLDAA